MQRVLVTGATGFLGQSVYRVLKDAGHHVRALARTVPSGDGDYVQGSMTDSEALMKACEGIDVIVHLAARKSDEIDSEEVNMRGTGELMKAATHHGVKHVIYVSTQSVRLRNRGTYAETKLQAEAICKASGIKTTILRPSLIYGENADGAFGSIMKFCYLLPIVPIVGNGHAGFHPLHRDDCAQMICNLIDDQTKHGATYDIGGRERYSFDELVDLFLNLKGIWKPRLHLPLMLFHVLSMIPGLPLTRSNVLGAAEDLPMENEYFSVQPRELLDQREHLVPRSRNPLDDEAHSLLTYITRWNPNHEVLDRFKKACSVHNLQKTSTLSPLLLRIPVMIGPVDALTRLLFPTGRLQKKMLIAASIVETSPTSADWLLPKDRSVVMLIATATLSTMSIACKWILSLPLLIWYPSLKARYG